MLFGQCPHGGGDKLKGASLYSQPDRKKTVSFLDDFPKFIPSIYSRCPSFPTCRIFCKIGKGQNNGRRDTSVPVCPHPFLKLVASITFKPPQTKVLVQNNGRRHTSVQFSPVVCPYRQFHGFYFELHLTMGSAQKDGSSDGDSANPANSSMAGIKRNIKDLQGDFTNSPPQIVINCFQSVFVLVIAIVETEVLNCPLKTVETSLLSRLSRLYC